MLSNGIESLTLVSPDSLIKKKSVIEFIPSVYPNMKEHTHVVFSPSRLECC